MWTAVAVTASADRRTMEREEMTDEGNAEPAFLRLLCRPVVDGDAFRRGGRRRPP